MQLSLRTFQGKHHRLARNAILLIVGIIIGSSVAVASAGNSQQPPLAAARLAYADNEIPACVDILTGAMRIVMTIPAGLEENPPPATAPCDSATEFVLTP